MKANTKTYYTINRGCQKSFCKLHGLPKTWKKFRQGLPRLKAYQFSSNKRKDRGALLWPFEDMHNEDWGTLRTWARKDQGLNKIWCDWERRDLRTWVVRIKGVSAHEQYQLQVLVAYGRSCGPILWCWRPLAIVLKMLDKVLKKTEMGSTMGL